MGFYTGFTFNGIHSSSFHLLRVSDGSMYDKNLTLESSDTTISAPNGIGIYLTSATVQPRKIDITIAFDELTDGDLLGMYIWLDGLTTHSLIFDEEPDKVFEAKVASAVELSVVCFDGTAVDSEDFLTSDGNQFITLRDLVFRTRITNKHLIYKGEGKISFICYQPYAHSLTTAVVNHGDMAAPLDYIDANFNELSLTINNHTLSFSSRPAGIRWNSKTGFVTNYAYQPIPFIGDSKFKIPVGAAVVAPDLTKVTMYNWYY